MSAQRTRIWINANIFRETKKISWTFNNNSHTVNPYSTTNELMMIVQRLNTNKTQQQHRYTRRRIRGKKFCANIQNYYIMCWWSKKKKQLVEKIMMFILINSHAMSKWWMQLSAPTIPASQLGWIKTKQNRTERTMIQCEQWARLHKCVVMPRCCFFFCLKKIHNLYFFSFIFPSFCI